MASIQRGDNRQYMAHELTQRANVGQEISNGINSVFGAVQKANASKLASNQIDLSNKYMMKVDEINNKYQADPTSEDRQRELKESFDLLAGQYKVNPLVQGQWNEIKNNVFNQYKQYDGKWQLAQQQSNAKNDLQNGYTDLVNQAGMMGSNGANLDQVRMSYLNGIEALRNGAKYNLGEVDVDNALKNATHDFMASYLSGLAVKDPLQAQKLLQDESVLNDIGDVKSIEDLKGYTNNQIKTLNQTVAVNELGNSLRNMNNEQADNILSGKADLITVKKFIESNKSLPEGSKDLILGIYGIGKKNTEYYYDRDKKIITKKPISVGGSGGRISADDRAIGARNSKITSMQKAEAAAQLESDLHDLIAFNDVINVKDVKKSKGQQQAQASVFSYMQRVADLQGRIDSAYSAGAITASQRKQMMNDYIAPVTNYLEQNLSQLDEKSWTQKKLGYGRIQAQFSTVDSNGKSLKGKALQEAQTQKLFAQGYYFKELMKAADKLGYKSIYELENLKPSRQREIYETASENALKQAKRWTNNPAYYFQKEYPSIYNQPYGLLGQEKAKKINQYVANQVYKKAFEDDKGNLNIDLKDYAQKVMKDKIKQEITLQTQFSKEILKRPNEATISAPAPKNFFEMRKEVENMGIGWQDFIKMARTNNYVDDYASDRTNLDFKGFTNALLALRRSKTMYEKRK